MSGLGSLNRSKAAFVLVDIQERFAPFMADIGEVIANANILAKAAEILGIPLIVTEQYPKGLGKTVGKIVLPETKHLIEKINFSCFGCEEFCEKIKELGAEDIVLFGVEAHVCILKTALDAAKNNLHVHVVADAVTSRTHENRHLALERMRQSGVFIVSTEMILFQLMDRADTQEFREISKLIK